MSPLGPIAANGPSSLMVTSAMSVPVPLGDA
jgi:hypothetical protein